MLSHTNHLETSGLELSLLRKLDLLRHWLHCGSVAKKRGEYPRTQFNTYILLTYSIVHHFLNT
jgi:hypothetical protein